MVKRTTSWGAVSDWYGKSVAEKDSYQNRLILPNLRRLIVAKKGTRILDLACGEGFFLREFQKTGAEIVGVDISTELIKDAVKKSSSSIEFIVAPSHDLSKLKDEDFDKIICILALQNIEKVQRTFAECQRVLKTGGKMYLVLNHPAFRIPKKSSWGFSKDTGEMWRRLDAYLSESHEEIKMHPGKLDSPSTVSFHRPLQWYFKIFNSNGFLVERLEEWISDKASELGPHQKEEDRVRKEFPLFLFLQLTKE